METNIKKEDLHKLLPALEPVIDKVHEEWITGQQDEQLIDLLNIYDNKVGSQQDAETNHVSDEVKKRLNLKTFYKYKTSHKL